MNDSFLYTFSLSSPALSSLIKQELSGRENRIFHQPSRWSRLNGCPLFRLGPGPKVALRLGMVGESRLPSHHPHLHNPIESRFLDTNLQLFFPQLRKSCLWVGLDTSFQNPPASSRLSLNPLFHENSRPITDTSEHRNMPKILMPNQHQKDNWNNQKICDDFESHASLFVVVRSSNPIAGLPCVE